MSKTPRRIRPILLAALVLVLGVALHRTLPVRAQAGVPDTVLALLPAGAQVQDARSADFTDAGMDGWAVLYTVPHTLNNGFTLHNWSVLIAVQNFDGGFFTGTVFTIPDANVGVLTVADVAGTPAAALEAGVGAHAARMTVMRWDGAAFATVFADSTDTPGFDFKDVDGDGQPEVVQALSPYCRAYVASPQIVIVYKWDGVQFSEWAGPYPQDLIGQRLDFALRITGEMADWQPDDQACVWGVVAFLRARGGDAAGADAACQQAKAIAPAWEDPRACPAYILSPIEKVRHFYDLLNQKLFFTAWPELSTAFRAQQGDEMAWIAGYKTMQSATLNSIQYVAGSTTSVAVSLTTIDLIDGATVTRRFSGTWTLVMEDGVWKLDTADIQPIP